MESEEKEAMMGSVFLFDNSINSHQIDRQKALVERQANLLHLFKVNL